MFEEFIGDFADLNQDGTVDFAEYLTDVERRDEILNDFDDDDELDTDFFDDISEKPDYIDDFDYQTDSLDNNGCFKLTFDDGEYIVCPDGVRRKPEKDKNNITEYFFDDYYEHYCIGRAVYCNFKIVRDNFTLNESLEFDEVINKIYKFDRKTGLEILLWLFANFQKAIINNNDENLDCAKSCGIIMDSMSYFDRHDNRDNLFCDYVYTHCETENLILAKIKYSYPSFIAGNYLPYLMKRGDYTRFKECYFLFVNGVSIDGNYTKYEFLKKLLFDLKEYGISGEKTEMYNFFKAEIESISQPVKIKELLEDLDTSYGVDTLFILPSQNNAHQLTEKLNKTEKEIAEYKDLLAFLERKKEIIKQQLSEI